MRIGANCRHTLKDTSSTAIIPRSFGVQGGLAPPGGAREGRQAVRLLQVPSLSKGPEKAYEPLVYTGVESAAKTFIRVFHQSVYAECSVGFGGVLSIVVAGGLAEATYSDPELCSCGALPVKPPDRPTHRGILFTGTSAS